MFLNRIIDYFLIQDYNKYKMNRIHDDMFLEYIKAEENDEYIDYVEFKKEYYSNLIKQQRYF
jgi:hypothetical protein